MIKQAQGWSARKNYMFKAIAKDDEAQNTKSLEKISTSLLRSPS